MYNHPMPRRLLSLLLTLMMLGCASHPVPAPTTSLVPTGIRTSTSAPILLTATLDNAMSIEAQSLLTASEIRFDSWSPGSVWFAYWSDDDHIKVGEYEEGPAPAAALRFFNTVTGQTCTHNNIVSVESGQRLRWQSDVSAIILLHDQEPTRITPCGSAIPTTYTELPLSQSVSPHGRYAANTDVVVPNIGCPYYAAVTTLSDTMTDEILITYEWKAYCTEGEVGSGGEWITENKFLINDIKDGSPVILQANGQVIPVITEVFGLTSDTEAEVQGEIKEIFHVAWGAQIQSGEYHILLFSKIEDNRFWAVKLFHSETGQVEDLNIYAHSWGAQFSPDGRSFIIWGAFEEAEVFGGSYDWLRLVDPPGSEFQWMEADFYERAWSPNGEFMAVATYTKDASGQAATDDFILRILRLSDQQVIATWHTNELKPYPAGWSPDGKWLVVVGHETERDRGVALYLFAH
jgi:hypothetical protein